MLKPFPASITTQTRQVCNLFQEPVKKTLLAFRIAEEKKQTGSKLFSLDHKNGPTDPQKY